MERLDYILRDSFSQTLMKYRGLRGISQLQLGNELGLCHSIISQWESRKKSPTANSLARLMLVFGRAFIDEVFDGCLEEINKAEEQCDE